MAKKIIIVEDDMPIAKALKLKLDGAGFESKVVLNGKEAVDELAKTEYDLMLLDLMMPVMDGFAVLEQLKKEGSKLPVIVLTNLSQDEDIERAKGLGAKDYFVKSDMNLTDLVKYINKFFGSK
jgi:DNA-binding response OmpR family regulator